MQKPEDLSTRTLAALFDQSTDCVKLLDPEGRVVWMNSNGQNVLEIDDFCAVEGGLWAEFWPQEQRHLIHTALIDGPDSSTHRFRAPCPTTKGKMKWWDVTVSPVGGTDNAHAGFLAISRDISVVQQTYEAHQLALLEMRKRLSNVFATATHLLASQSIEDATDAEALETLRATRQKTLAAVQTMFAGQHANVRTGTILSTILAPFRPTRCDVEIGPISDRVLDSETGDSLALVLGELCLHAAQDGVFARGGTLRVETILQDNQLALRWDETPDPETAPTDWLDTSGLELITRIVAARTHALTLDIGATALSATLLLSQPPTA